jgi:hypothetical protein
MSCFHINNAKVVARPTTSNVAQFVDVDIEVESDVRPREV